MIVKIHHNEKDYSIDFDKGFDLSIRNNFDGKYPSFFGAKSPSVKPNQSGDFIGDDNIIDYGIAVSKDGFTFGLSDTDIDGSDVKAYVAYSVDFTL